MIHRNGTTLSFPRTVASLGAMHHPRKPKH
jgi:hypothetical protein